MTPRPHTLAADAVAYDAALVMARHGIRHAPVMEEGRMIGIVSQRDLFSVQRVTLRQLPETIAGAQDEAALGHAARDIRQLTKDMLVNGVAAEQLTQFIAALNDRLTQRVLELELPRHRLDDVRFCWIALGSEGRLEQTFATDQDNGLIFNAPAAMPVDEARERLLPFAAAVNKMLDRCGFPLCKGEIMAGNRRWCLSLAEWQTQFSAWIRNTSAEAVLNSAIFFDFRPVFGDAALAERLRSWLLPVTRATPRFLLQMAQGALATRPPLGIIRDFTFDHSPESPHTLDLKLYGLRPFVEAARINALRFGIAHTNTAQRLRLAAPELHVSADDMRAIVDAFYFIQLLRLRHQQFDPDAARAPNRVDPDRLNAFDRRILKESFLQARELQQRIALDFTQ
jgi:CBS domain-containing protein